MTNFETTHGPTTDFPINESSRHAFVRRDYPHLVRVDAAELRDAIERSTGEPLIRDEARANAYQSGWRRDAISPNRHQRSAPTRHRRRQSSDRRGGRVRPRHRGCGAHAAIRASAPAIFRRSSRAARSGLTQAQLPVLLMRAVENVRGWQMFVRHWGCWAARPLHPRPCASLSEKSKRPRSG